MPTDYIDAACIPPGFRITDPSKFTKVGIDTLWSHWQQREREKLPILFFIKARPEDLPARQAPLEFHPPRKRNYVEIQDPTKTSEKDCSPADGPNLEDLAGKRKAASPTSDAPSAVDPSPKRLRHSFNDQLAVPEDTSSAANQLNRGTFLQSLSMDPSYIKLITTLHALPRLVSYLCISIYVVLFTVW